MKQRLMCAIMFDQNAPCNRCKFATICPLDSHQKQQIIGVVRKDPASIIAWFRPAEREACIEELSILPYGAIERYGDEE
jgi:hypothetical protein